MPGLSIGVGVGYEGDRKGPTRPPNHPALTMNGPARLSLVGF
jgi:hypothetical protein